MRRTLPSFILQSSASWQGVPGLAKAPIAATLGSLPQCDRDDSRVGYQGAMAMISRGLTDSDKRISLSLGRSLGLVTLSFLALLLTYGPARAGDELTEFLSVMQDERLVSLSQAYIDCVRSESKRDHYLRRLAAEKRVSLERGKAWRLSDQVDDVRVSVEVACNKEAYEALDLANKSGVTVLADKMIENLRVGGDYEDIALHPGQVLAGLLKYSAQFYVNILMRRAAAQLN